MPTYENMYYYLEHSIREALQDLEQQNFGAAKKTLTSGARRKSPGSRLSRGTSAMWGRPTPS